MLRLPVLGRVPVGAGRRLKCSSSFIRSTYIEFFEQRAHRVVRSSPVVPLSDPSVPFVNAGMNQFKGVFLGTVEPPHPRVVTSQKCIRVGGKHNDLDVVGTDGHHHTFFEMLGNWSFGDYYKKEACEMAWELLLGPYRLKPEDLVVTYFGGDAALGLTEDIECRDIWRKIGVPPSRLQARGAADNFWEAGAAGPCGPCTELHHVARDGSLTEIWNLVFIEWRRDASGALHALPRRHVDTGLGLERLAALLQAARSNYDTDLFAPLMRTVHEASGAPPYSGAFGAGAAAARDAAYRRLADHARMVAVCLADGLVPAASLNLRQILRRSFQLSADAFGARGLLPALYDAAAAALAPAYPELLDRRNDAHVILRQEEESYYKLRAELARGRRRLAAEHPEAAGLAAADSPGFAQGYREFKQTMSKSNSTVIPGELAFKLYDTHGIQEDVIQRMAELNGLTVDQKGFENLLHNHRNRHKTAFKEKVDEKGVKFNSAIETIVNSGCSRTNDQPKYGCTIDNDNLNFEPLKTKLVAILTEEGDWIDYLEPPENVTYYLVAEDTNFFCEEGGQSHDTGRIQFENDCHFEVENVFKIRHFVFHKGSFKLQSNRDDIFVNNKSAATFCVNSERRLNLMQNHTAIHLLNAALRKALPNSVISQMGSKVSDTGLVLNVSIYGEKLTQKAIIETEDLIRAAIAADAPVRTSVLDAAQLAALGDVTRVPGETYPEAGLRLVHAEHPGLRSKELCCGTHVPSTRFVRDVCVTHARGLRGAAPAVLAVAGERAMQARELFSRVQKLSEAASVAGGARVRREAAEARARLGELRGGSGGPEGGALRGGPGGAGGSGGGAPAGRLAASLATLDALDARAGDDDDADAEASLQALAQTELAAAAAAAGGAPVVLFLRCSYLMSRPALPPLLRALPAPALLLACAGGVLHAAAHVPRSHVTASFTAEQWLQCALPAFGARLKPATQTGARDELAEMEETKVSLITCEQQVQSALVATREFAASHAPAARDQHRHRQ